MTALSGNGQDNANQALATEPAGGDPVGQDRWARGLAMYDRIYGAGTSAFLAGMQGVPLIDESLGHMFGEIWARPGLSMRDKRLLVIGATTMLGRSELLEIQIAGAIVNGELSDEELDEIALFMLFYAGAGNANSLHQGIVKARARASTLASSRDGPAE